MTPLLLIALAPTHALRDGPPQTLDPEPWRSVLITVLVTFLGWRRNRQSFKLLTLAGEPLPSSQSHVWLRALCTGSFCPMTDW